MWRGQGELPRSQGGGPGQKAEGGQRMRTNDDHKRPRMRASNNRENNKAHCPRRSNAQGFGSRGRRGQGRTTTTNNVTKIKRPVAQGGQGESPRSQGRMPGEEDDVQGRGPGEQEEVQGPGKQRDVMPGEDNDHERRHANKEVRGQESIPVYAQSATAHGNSDDVWQCQSGAISARP